MHAFRAALLVVAVVLVGTVAAPERAGAVIPAGTAQYQATIAGATYEYDSLAGGYVQTAAVNLPALLFVEPRRIAPRATSPVVGLFTGRTPALDNRPGSINFATNTQGFHVDPNVLGPTQAAIDIAAVQAEPGAGTLQATVDGLAARGVQVELFRVSSSIFSAPAQILAGSLTLRFSADGRAITGNFDLGGNDHIEPGNPLFPVKRYVANVTAQLSSLTPPAGGAGDVSPPVISSVGASRTTFRLGSALPKISRLPVGTTISFGLSEPAKTTIAFSQGKPGRRVGTRCVAPNQSNRRRRPCTRHLSAGSLTFAAHAGRNTVRFQGRLSRQRSLKPGRYSMTITAVDAAGNKSRRRTIRLTALHS